MRSEILYLPEGIRLDLAEPGLAQAFHGGSVAERRALMENAPDLGR
jgi:hypothetical protein